jgi:hypothetical protein
LVHPVILRDPRTSEIARSVPFELAGGYHAAAAQLSRFGNIAEKTLARIGTRLTSPERVHFGAESGQTQQCCVEQQMFVPFWGKRGALSQSRFAGLVSRTRHSACAAMCNTVAHVAGSSVWGTSERRLWR